MVGYSDTCLMSQHLGVKDWWISEFDVSLTYIVSSRLGRTM